MDTQKIRILLQTKISELELNWYVHVEQNKAEIFDSHKKDLIGTFEISSSNVFLTSMTTNKENLERLISLQNELFAANEATFTPSHVGTGTLNEPEYKTVPVIVIASVVLGIITTICFGLILGYILFG